MATWKKLAVSGSNVSQFNNDAGYLTSGTLTVPNGFSTGSFAGTDLLANSTTGDFSVVSGSGAGLKITADAGTRIATFTLADVPNSSLENSTISGISLGSDLNDLTVDDATLTLNSGTTYNGSAAKTISVKDGGIDTDAIADSLGTIGVNSFTGSFSGSFTGDVTIDLADLTDGNGIVDFTYDGNSPATVTVQVDSTTGGDTVPVAVSANGVGLDLTSIDGTGIGTTGAGELTIDLTEVTLGNGLDATDATSLYLDLTEIVLSNGLTAPSSGALDLDLTEVIATDGANRVLTSDGDGTLTAEPNFTFNGATDLLTVTGDALITGDLTVQGTASFQSTQELLVADRFVLFASGSNAAGDGGIVVQQDTQNIGEVFAFDSGTTRWGLTGSFDATNTAYTPDAFMAAVVEGAGTDPDAAPARYDKKGNIFVGTDEAIWIYS
jgi:hypothetical protein